LGAGAKVAILPAGSAGDGAPRRAGKPDAALDALPEGRLVFVDNAIDPATGTIHAKAEVPNANSALWPGQYVTARLKLLTIAGAVVIPQLAVIQRGDANGVYVADAQGVVAWRPVTTRHSFGEFAVVEGVRGGERVVTEGKQNVKPGAVVKDAGRHAPTAGAAQ
jgi:RND family efflux transporter MFP subunit